MCRQYLLERESHGTSHQSPQEVRCTLAMEGAQRQCTIGHGQAMNFLQSQRCRYTMAVLQSTRLCRIRHVPLETLPNCDRLLTKKHRPLTLYIPQVSLRVPGTPRIDVHYSVATFRPLCRVWGLELLVSGCSIRWYSHSTRHIVQRESYQEI